MKKLLSSFIILCLLANVQSMFAEDRLKNNEFREHCNRVTIYVGNGQDVDVVDALFVFNGLTKTIVFTPERKTGPSQYFKFSKYSYREHEKTLDYTFPIVGNEDLISIDLHIEKNNSFICLHYTDFDAYFNVDHSGNFPYSMYNK